MNRIPGRSDIRTARLLVTVAGIALATAAGGCATTPSSPSDVTGSIAIDNAPRSEAEWRREMDVWGPRYRANPSDSQAAIRYAQALPRIQMRLRMS
jgi:hypothetical protein